MKRALILTVGTGTRPGVTIVKPLVKTIRNSNPNFTVFLVSKESRSYAEQIVAELGMAASEHKVRQLSDSDDVQKIFVEGNAAIRDLFELGFKPEEITADYTSGTKAMTAGLVLSAVFNSCDSLKYITGERINGIVQDGTEKFVAVSPTAVFARREIQLGLQLMEEMRFESALRIFNSANHALLDDYEKKLLANATLLANAYGSWDRFDHFRFCGEYEKASFQLRELAKYEINKAVLRRLKGMGENLKNSVVSDDVIADLSNNATRRLREGKYDDALARLYRVAEMLAQLVLKKDFHQETGNIDLARISPDKMGDLDTYRDEHDDNKVKIGLKRAFQLLAALGTDVGRAFISNKELHGILKDRNDSILAHGTKPIKATACEGLRYRLHDLLMAVIPDIDKRCSDLQFPWLRTSTPIDSS